MTHASRTRFALAVALLISPAAFVGCTEETKPIETPATTPATTPTVTTPATTTPPITTPATTTPEAPKGDMKTETKTETPATPAPAK